MSWRIPLTEMRAFLTGLPNLSITTPLMPRCTCGARAEGVGVAVQRPAQPGPICLSTEPGVSQGLSPPSPPLSACVSEPPPSLASVPSSVKRG